MPIAWHGLVYAPAAMIRSVVLVCLALSATPLLAADGHKGRLLAALRYRYEQVDQTGFAEDGQASTLRTALGYETADWHRMRLLVEFEDVTDLGLGDEHANGAPGDLSNGITDRPVIADPEDTEFNQALLHVAAAKHVGVVVGREELNVNDERFIGASAWRQNHETLDLVRVAYDSKAGPTGTYAYIDGANRVTGDRKPLAGHVLFARVPIGDAVAVRGTALWLDYDRDADAALSSQTYTLGASYTRPGRSWTLALDAEIGQQSDAGDNPASYDEPYLRATIEGRCGTLSLGAGYELLGGDGVTALQTPLATLHKWNGWVDKFLTTPPSGLEDVWVTLGTSAGRVRLTAVYHDFSADESGGGSYGTEWNLEALYTASWKQKFALTAGHYEADTFATDTTKIWAWTSWVY
jgi:hypothetical protein